MSHHSHRRRPRRGASRALALLALGACLVLAALLPGIADAGLYHVYGCRTPIGVSVPADDWAPSATSIDAYTTDTCLSGGYLNAGLNGSLPHAANGSSATWTYTPPPQTSIAAASLWWSAGVNTNGENATGVDVIAAPRNAYDPGDVLDQCVGTSCQTLGNPVSPLSPANRVTIPGTNLTAGAQLFMSSGCGGVSGWSCPQTTSAGGIQSAWADLYASDITLQDTSIPTVSGVSGQLTTDNPLTGSEAVDFQAADTGPGLYSVTFTVDGQNAGIDLVGQNDGHCVDLGAVDGTHAFDYGQPCVAAASLDETLDTTQFSDGTHRVVVKILDASGNSAVVLDRTVAFSNDAGVGTLSVTQPPPGASPTPSPTASTPPSTSTPAPARGLANGSGASDHAHLTVRWNAVRGDALRSRWGATRAISGRLTTPNGTPIVHAAVEVVVSPSYEGAKPVLHGDVKTDASGRFYTALSGTQSSEAIRFLYFSHQGDKSPAASGFLKLSVPASLTLHITPRVSRVNRTIRFHGRLRGKPIPPAGQLLILEARSPGGAWIEFQVIRTNQRGRFHATYQFHLAGPAKYQFRVLSRYEAAFPFIEGASNVVTVRER